MMLMRQNQITAIAGGRDVQKTLRLHPGVVARGNFHRRLHRAAQKIDALTTRPPVTSRQGMMRLASMDQFPNIYEQGGPKIPRHSAAA